MWVCNVMDVLNLGVSPPGEPKGVIRAAGWDRSVISVPVPFDAPVSVGLGFRFVVDENGSEVGRERRLRMRKTEAATRSTPTKTMTMIRMVVRV